MHIRENWIQNTKFHQDLNGDVLQKVLTEIENAVKKKEVPVVIFDLDSTLFDVSGRSYQILKEWLHSNETKTFQETIELMEGLSPKEMRYSLEDVWNGRKIKHEATPHDHHFKHAKQFWKKRFFGNSYLPHDEPMPGALEFVKQVYERGAKVVYLTGRDVPLMAFGTYDQLKTHGFPVEVERTRVILKPKRHHDDLEFKTGVAKLAQEWGRVVASFENEPKNLMAMRNVFKPETMNIFVETVCSDHAAPAGHDIYRIRNFLK